MIYLLWVGTHIPLLYCYLPETPGNKQYIMVLLKVNHSGLIPFAKVVAEPSCTRYSTNLNYEVLRYRISSFSPSLPSLMHPMSSY